MFHVAPSAVLDGAGSGRRVRFLRREFHEIVAGVGNEDDPIEAIGRLGARLILQQALEEELSEFLGRER